MTDSGRQWRLAGVRCLGSAPVPDWSQPIAAGGHCTTNALSMTISAPLT